MNRGMVVLLEIIIISKKMDQSFSSGIVYFKYLGCGITEIMWHPFLNSELTQI